MKRFHKSEGSVLITAAIAAGIVSILVAGLLAMISNQYLLDNRGHQWNQALHLAEAAVEVGIGELNYQYMGGSGFQAGNGWVDLGGGASYSKTVTNFTNLNGNVVGDYTVIVTNQASLSPSVLGVGTCANSHGPTVSRAVKVTLKRTYNKAFYAKNGISFTNPSYIVDSFDSTDPTKSTGGLYNATKRQANAIMAIGTGTMAIKGDVYGTATIGSGGTVTLSGTIGNTTNAVLRKTTVPSAIAHGFITTGAAAPSYATPTVPFNTSIATSLGSISGNYTVSGSGDYTCSAITENTGQTVTFSGNIRLYMSGDLKLSGGGVVVPSGSTLEVYEATKITITGSGFINNAGPADNCSLFGLAATTWTLTGSGAFNATVYAPDAAISFTGPSGMSGAMIGDTLSSTGAGAFHYDEALGGSADYTAVSWKEYRNVAGSWVPN